MHWPPLVPYASCHELTSELILVGPMLNPDVNQHQVLLQFELVACFDESYVQVCRSSSTMLRSGRQSDHGRVPLVSC